MQVAPSRIRPGNEIQLPLPFPFLQSLLSDDCLIGRAGDLIVDEDAGAVFLRESLYYAVLVLPNATAKVVRHANIQRSAPLASKYIDVILPQVIPWPECQIYEPGPLPPQG